MTISQITVMGHTLTRAAVDGTLVVLVEPLLVVGGVAAVTAGLAPGEKGSDRVVLQVRLAAVLAHGGQADGAPGQRLPAVWAAVGRRAFVVHVPPGSLSDAAGQTGIFAPGLAGFAGNVGTAKGTGNVDLFWSRLDIDKRIVKMAPLNPELPGIQDKPVLFHPSYGLVPSAQVQIHGLGHDHADSLNVSGDVQVLLQQLQTILVHNSRQ